MDTPETSKAKGFLGTIVAGAAAVGAFILAQASEQLGQMGGEWLGASIFIPLVLVVLCCWIASKLIPQMPSSLRIGAGITSAQAIYHLLGGLLLGGGALLGVLPDVVILGAGTAWLIVRPGFWPIAVLIGFEAFAIAMNILTAFQYGFELSVLKGMISMLLIRIAAIIFLYNGWKAIRAGAPEATKEGATAS
jgi:hypothetical protein